MTSPAKLAPQGAQRKVGLDRPCTLCGRPIYFNYKSPMEGICGRCTDRIAKRRPERTETRTVFVERVGPGCRAGIWFLLGILAGAIAMYVAHPHLPF